MTVQTLTSPDVAVGEQVEVEVANGSGTRFITVIGSSGGGGGGAINSVTGTAPITASTDLAGNVTVGITAATDSAPGSMSAADKTKLDAITIESVSVTAPITSSGGATPTIGISAATDSAAGSMSAADKTKLDGLSAAPVDSVSVTAPITLGGSAQNPVVGISAATDSAAGSMSAADKTKLDGITTVVASVTATAPLTSSGGATPNLAITAATDSAAGSMSAADKTKADNYPLSPTILIYSPTGTAAANVYTSFATLFTAAGAIPHEPIEVWFVESTSTIPAGVYAFTNPDVVFQGPVVNGLLSNTLVFANGAHISGVNTFRSLNMQSASGTAVYALSGGTSFNILFDETALVTASSAFFSLTGAGTSLNLTLDDGSSIGDGTNPYINGATGTATVIAALSAASVDANVFTGAGTFNVSVLDVALFLGAGLPLTLDTVAAQLGYNDSLVSPALGVGNVQAAIDALKEGNPTTKWSDEAAGTSVAVAAQAAAQFFGQDTNTAAAGGVTPYTFPAHGTAIDGQEVTITLEGAAVNTLVTLNPGANNVMGDPNNAGQYGASGATLTASLIGQVIKRKYKDEGSSGKWRPF